MHSKVFWRLIKSYENTFISNTTISYKSISEYFDEKRCYSLMKATGTYLDQQISQKYCLRWPWQKVAEKNQSWHCDCFFSKNLDKKSWREVHTILHDSFEIILLYQSGTRVYGSSVHFWDPLFTIFFSLTSHYDNWQFIINVFNIEMIWGWKVGSDGKKYYFLQTLTI